MQRLSKTYNPKEVEDKIYKLWEKSGFFNPDKLPKTYNLKPKTYCIVIPPPNITGELHMGNALNVTIQDVLIRKKRMEGFKTLWLPGIDHAGIATQNVVEKELKKQGKTRFDLGRKKFEERVWEWKKKYGHIILDQLKKLGCSLDWSRTRFTMDKKYSQAVKKAFSHYYKKGWIYQGERTINWCTRCSTSLSDLEVIYKEEPAELYYIKYGPIPIATVRPETKLGDTAVAVNPKDIRYKKYIGKTIEIQTVLGKAKMKVIGDKSIDMSFGTGAMKVTPAHDIHDFELAEKHSLEKKQVIGPDGRMTKLAGKYTGLTVMEARKQIVEDMKKIRILKKVEPYTHNVASCYRCDTVLEPILSEQWFLKMQDLAQAAKKPVKEGKIKFLPKSFEKGYLSWLANVRDWCISRQLWWGHRIPLKGETDVLDTWFSSALWPFVTMGWPQEKSKRQKAKGKSDLEKFYPTDVLSTDRGIINLWVVRMIFSGMEFMKKIPFSKVYIHPTVLTREGKRMAKSLGTGIDPIQLVEKYGADATRFGMLFQVMGGQDIKFGEDNIVMGKKFCNKIWNASRFVMLQTVNEKLKIKSEKLQLKIKNLTQADQRILKSLDEIIKSAEQDIESFRFGQAAHKIYDFFWHDFCDIYLEKSKKQLSDNVRYSVKIQTQQILLYVLLNSLKILHPFVPFITEEIYQRMPVKKKKKCLMIETWPQPAKAG